MKKIYLLSALLVSYLLATAQIQVPYFGKITWVSGYSKEISGEVLSYTSAFPDYATTSLLTRCTNGTKAIEWETAPVPDKIKGKYVYFSWVAAHSSGTSSGVRYFDLYLNNQKLLTCATYPKHQRPNWIYTAPDSSALVFQQTKRDAANDAHGLAFLRIPKDKVKLGEPLKLKVVGTDQGSNDWYMTFRFSFEEKIDIRPMPFLLKDGRQTLEVTALHFGEDQNLQIRVNNKEVSQFRVHNGINKYDVPVRAVEKDDSVKVQALLANKVFVDRFFPLKPVRYRELHFIHHSHTDIGYSNLQPEVLKIHMKNIDDALRMIEATRHLPTEAQFKWNIESLWVVENYLKQASPEQKEHFISAVKEGRICLAALYANVLTGLSLPEETFHYTDFASRLREQYGITVNSAMISDIPGYAWTTVTALSHGGVKYFSSGPNYLGEQHPYGGDRVGLFVKTWGDKPVWWISPSGEEKVLFWTAAKGYSSWHGFAPGAIFERGPAKIAAYLEELERNNYPYDMVQWRYNVVADNGPIDSTISGFVDQWNKKYASPKIVLNTTERMFEEFEKRYGTDLPVVKGDITPYWEDGAISTSREEGENRRNSLRLQQLTTLYAMISPSQYHPEQFYEAWKNILLFHEHTWGAHNSISQPDIPFVTEQWRIKKQFLQDAKTEIDSLEHQLLHPLTQESSRTIAVFNTLSWRRSGPVILSSAFRGKSLKDQKGRILPVQKLSNGTYTFFSRDIPAFGTAVYEISDQEPKDVSAKITLTDSTLQNGKITLQWDKSSGSITKLLAGSSFNYAGTYNRQGLNSYWYVPGLNPAEAQSTHSVTIEVLERGPVVTAITFNSEAPGARNLQRIIRLYSESGVVDIENILDKNAVRSKEAVHFGFPFNALMDTTRLDAGYGYLNYGKDQLPGSNFDFLCGRRWIDVSSADKGVQLNMLEMPMMEPSQMIDERLLINQSHKVWRKESKPTSTWFSYVMNNYWHTNYKADQEGVSHFQYALRPHDQFNDLEIEQSATEFTQPLIAVPLNVNYNVPAPLLELTNNHIVITCIMPQEGGDFIIRLYNPEATSSETAFVWKQLKPSGLINMITGKRISPDEKISIVGMGVTEIKLVK